MRRIWAVVLVCACAACAGTPKVEQSVLLEEQAKYEARLKSAEEQRARETKACEKDKADLDGAKKELTVRVEQLEGQLAEKQRTLDDVTSQLVDLQDAFGKLSSKERQKVEELAQKDKAKRAARSELAARFLEAMKPEIDEKKVEAVEKGETLTLRFKDGMLFLKGSTRIQPGAQAALERLGKAAKATPEAMLRFDAHTDAVRAEHKGERKDTWILTGEQGLELVRALQKMGVDPSRLAYASFGQFKPIASNDTEEGRTQNRRIEVVVRREFR